MARFGKEPVDSGSAETDLRTAAELGFLDNGSDGTSFVDPDVRLEGKLALLSEKGLRKGVYA
jgi:hypothetical protein